MKARTRSGFTLIEMLAVLGVIGILAGLVFKLMAFATRKATAAQTMSYLEAIANAVEEFRAEYGQYPPCTNVEYVYECTSNQDQNIYLYLQSDTANELFRFGLASYLLPRPTSALGETPSRPPHTQSFTRRESWVGDTPRDAAAKARWASLLENVYVYTSYVSNSVSGFGSGVHYFNIQKTFLDGWSRPVQYGSSPPYQSYKLWSLGADGTPNTSDDIHRESWDEAAK
jgi:prepilin-type N-terminal cleavage/methylation domain-containing protein